MTGGDFWEVSGIDVADGAGMKYANWLASEWRKNLEFAKSKGWIKDYKVLANNYPRKGEPDLYLIRIMDRIATGPEGEERAKEWVKHMEKSMAKMQEESGNRAEYREVMSSSLKPSLRICRSRSSARSIATTVVSVFVNETMANEPGCAGRDSDERTL